MIKWRHLLSTKIMIMVNVTDVIRKDLKHIWHPCMQMKDFEACPPLVVYEAKGSHLYTDRGCLIDGISSWWCKSLGHGHPAIKAAIQKQLESFEQVIAANTTHPVLADLGEKLAQISGKQHVFFASDGSCAVEIAMKMALHAKQLQGQRQRSEFIALQNSYHGETLATMSVSDLGIYKKPYIDYGVTCHFLNDIPYINTTGDSLWRDCSPVWNDIVMQLEEVKHRCCAILVEPLVQGAGGMLCYSADFLSRLSQWARQNDIFLIADEIMTGMGRTGHWLACQHAGVTADFICLSKGLTAGALPMSCVLVDHDIFTCFYDDYEKGKSFLHSHTHSGNALAVSAALATIQVMDDESLNNRAIKLGELMYNQMNDIANLSGKLQNIRSLGAVVAADMVEWNSKRLGYEFYQASLRHGALLRPIGNTLYWLPPLTTDDKTIMQLAEITLNSLYDVYK
ncbi:adenosylmethionine-8-amino-7-oxononanoate aminotransferase [Legionella spiritensis]|nr:adenosylmethionine-8-amino-7-oxononanoate aminotransferase [Legionella spiritensis]